MKPDTRYRLSFPTAIACSLLLVQPIVAATPDRSAPPAIESTLRIADEAVLFLPGIASTTFSEVRLTLSPDGRTALWFSRDRPGGPGGYDIWMTRRDAKGWGRAKPASFNSVHRDFDPAFSSDGRHVYFCSDRPAGLGGDDVYRVAVTGDGFGPVEHLGAAINSAGNEFAPMLSADRSRLLFSSDRPGGAGGHDLYAARRFAGDDFAPAQRLPGAINTRADEFDATYLSDGSTVVFARAPDLRSDRIDLFTASLRGGHYGTGTRLPSIVNSADKDTYGPMLDWSSPDRFTVSAQHAGATGMDLYLVRYALDPVPSR